MTVVILAVILLAVAIVVGAAVVFGVVLTRSAKRAQVEGSHVPGVDVAVPPSWALSHDPEARLHRRIRDAAVAMDATIGQADVAQIERRAQLLVTAQQLEERLLTIAALPHNAKAEPLAAVQAGVADFEKAAAQIALEQ